MSNPITISQHYEQLLSLVYPWIVEDIQLNVEELSLHIYVNTLKGSKLPCPVCGQLCSKVDHREERKWRHLDTMQFQTFIACSIPRISCPEHGVKSVQVPWAGKYSRFTLLFEKFAVDVLLAAKSIKAAIDLLRLSWDQIQEIQERAVERGLARRKNETIEHIGIDEKNFLKGHSYISSLTDLDKVRVLEVVKDRTQESAETLLNTLTDEQKANVKAAAMDMWKPFMQARETILPEAETVHDKFHISGYLTKAVDKVRSKENKTLAAGGDSQLKNTKYLWLANPENWNEEYKKTFKGLVIEELKVGKAWALKELFRHFWEYNYPGVAEKFFKQWYFRATHSRLKPIIEVAKTLKRHLQGLLAYIKHKITNAATEGLNSKIQSIKANARGFRNFQHYRVAILFHCGKLKLYP